MIDFDENSTLPHGSKLRVEIHQLRYIQVVMLRCTIQVYPISLRVSICLNFIDIQVKSTYDVIRLVEQAQLYSIGHDWQSYWNQHVLLPCDG